jgi:plastocyanin
MTRGTFTTRLVLATTLVCLICAPALADAAKAEGPRGTATIKGKVMLDGEKPAMRPIQMNADQHCQKLHQKPVAPQGKMVFEDGSVPYGFVYLKSGVEGKYKVPADPVELDQEGCMYKPHVFGMIAGQSLKILNNDDTTHNINAQPKRNRGFNFAQAQKGAEKVLTGAETFNRPEVMIEFKCNVHPWMSAYVGVLEHPFFAVSGRGGAFEIPEVPAGKYTLAVWHEEWGALETEIEVKDGATVEHTFTFKKDAAQAGPSREVIVQPDKE